MDKRIQAQIAIAIAALIALAGSFAWYSFNQRKQNIFELLSAPNVNLHDDFAGGPKKDVYVENSGSMPVLVRVRLTELLRLGENLLPENAIDASDEMANWHIHTPEAVGCDACAFEAHKYYTWGMGGQKFYMPAHPSARGYTDEDVYVEPVAVGDKSRIIDYRALLMQAFQQIYFDDQLKLSTLLDHINEYMGGDDTKAAFIQEEIRGIPDNYLVRNVKQYEGQSEGEYVRKLNEVSLTRTPMQIISMDDWIGGTTFGEPRKTGDFWVMDSDGWCYWANALRKGQATGLLISSVTKETQYPGGNMIYKINVSLNATTYEEMELNTFFLLADQNGGITEAAMELMFLASGEYVLREDGGIYLNEGGGTYRKIERNPKTNSYINYVPGEQIHVEPEGQAGRSGSSFYINSNDAVDENRETGGFYIDSSDALNKTGAI